MSNSINIPIPTFPNSTSKIEKFGRALAINQYGTRLAISATKEFFPNQGIVFIYDLKNSPDNDQIWQLNYSFIASSNNVHIYNWNKQQQSWEAVTPHQSSNNLEWAGFGTSLAISDDGNNILVGAPGTQDTFNPNKDVGGVLHFKMDNLHDGISYLKILGDGNSSSFGTSVAYTDTHFAVGEPHNNCVHIFNMERDKITFFQDNDAPNFGQVIAMTENMLAICAPESSSTNKLAHIYTPKDSTAISKWRDTNSNPLTISDTTLTNQGNSIAIHGQRIVIGSAANKKVFVLTPQGSSDNPWKTTNNQTLTKSDSGFGTSVAHKDFGIAISTNGQECYWSKFTQAATSQIPEPQKQSSATKGSIITIGGNTIVISNPNTNKVSVITLGKGNVYLRDTINDDGTPKRHGSVIRHGSLSLSPDIYPSANKLEAPEQFLGNWNNNPIPQKLAQDSSNYIYFRMHNKGSGLAFPKTHVFYSKPTSFNAPNQWNQIDHTPHKVIYPGEKRIISEPVVWNISQSVEPHSCVIACLSGNGTMFLSPPEIDTLLRDNPTQQGFIDLVAANTGVSFRNVSVVNISLPNSSNLRSSRMKPSTVELGYFYAQGSKYHPSEISQITFQSNLPESTSLALTTDIDNHSIKDKSFACTGEETQEVIIGEFSLPGDQLMLVRPVLKFGSRISMGDYYIIFNQYEQWYEKGREKRVLVGAYRFVIQINN